MMRRDLEKRLVAALPAVRAWIEQTLEQHRGRSRPLSRLGFHRLPRYFPPDVLESTRVITLPRVPFPPLRRLGLAELSDMEDESLDGITFGDAVFVNELRTSESLCFHELVHAVGGERHAVVVVRVRTDERRGTGQRCPQVGGQRFAGQIVGE